EVAAVAVSRTHQLADRVAPQGELLCERLVDDGDLGRIHGVGIRKLASGDERDAERGEVARTDFVVVGVAVRVWSGLEPLYGDISLPIAARQNRHIRYRHGRH